MIGSDHAGRINAIVTDERDGFNLGGDLSFILYSKILSKTKDRLDVSLDEYIQIGREAVMEDAFFRVVSKLFPFREGYDRTAVVLAWASYVTSLCYINIEIWRGSDSLMSEPKPEDVLEIRAFIDRERADDGDETEATIRKIIKSIKAPNESGSSDEAES